VCPWNKFAQVGREAKLSARAELREPSLADLGRLDDASFRALFAKSPIKRIGRDRFIRNVLIAIGNSGDADLADDARRLLGDESPLVRGAAVWALGQLLAPATFAELAKDSDSKEPNEDVQREWRHAL
jgi:epoxyqueuosine reductase